MLSLLGKLFKVVLAGTVAGAVAGWLRNSNLEKVRDLKDRAIGSPSASTHASTEPRAQEPEAPVEAEVHTTYTELTREVTEAAVPDSDTPRWVHPVNGECPETHQIKARFQNGRYYRPTDRGYAKVRADSCYATVEDAEADGFSKTRW